MDKDRSFWRLPLQIAAALLLVGLVGFIGRLVVVQVAMSSLSQSLHESSVRMDAAVRASAERAKREQAERKAHRQALERIRRQDELAKIQASADRERAAALAHQQKEAAWQAFYQPSSTCLRTASVECGNEHIRARRDFETRYASGQFN